MKTHRGFDPRNFSPEAPMFNDQGYQGTAIFELNDQGEPEMVGFRGVRKFYRLEVGGNLSDENIAEVFHDCTSQEERLAWMWAYAICEHPTLAWYNDPADPGTVSNKRFTQEGWDKLPVHIKTMARKFADEDNQACAEDDIDPRTPWINGGL